MSPQPPLTEPAQLAQQLAQTGWAVLSAEALSQLCAVPAAALHAWQPHWHELPPDQHLRDGGHYRRRRHSCFVVQAQGQATAQAEKQAAGADVPLHQVPVQQVPHRAHWQPVEYNALHGGFERWFEAMPPAWTQDDAWHRLLLSLAAVANRLKGASAPMPWFVEAHPFRITTEGGIGRPTPEGAHRDGVDLVVVLMVQRHNVKGGETRVFDARGPQGVRFTLNEPWSALLLDDERVIHESTPIQNQVAEQAAWRDTLVLTFRQHGFQGR